jgi:hypothetical protein
MEVCRKPIRAAVTATASTVEEILDRIVHNSLHKDWRPNGPEQIVRASSSILFGIFI